MVRNLYTVGSCVRLGEEKTEWFKLEVGLRQGCILSPILFSIFIDKLAEEVQKVGGAKYAELVVSLLLDSKMLQRMLDVVYKYSQRYRFRFNKDKSNVMIFGRKNKKEKFI